MCLKILLPACQVDLNRGCACAGQLCNNTMKFTMHPNLINLDEWMKIDIEKEIEGWQKDF